MAVAVSRHAARTPTFRASCRPTTLRPSSSTRPRVRVTTRRATPTLVRPGYVLGRQGTLIATPADHQRFRPRPNWESNNAVDIGVPRGTPVTAISPGRIGTQFGTFKSKDPKLQGLRLHLHSRNNEYYYAHLSRYAPGIKPGANVTKGQVIGYSGVANRVPHLHFGVRSGSPLRVLGGALRPAKTLIPRRR